MQSNCFPFLTLRHEFDLKQLSQNYDFLLVFSTTSFFYEKKLGQKRIHHAWLISIVSVQTEQRKSSRIHLRELLLSVCSSFMEKVKSSLI